MSKVIGAKVSDKLYEKIASLGPISDIVKQSVNEYLGRRKHIQNNEVNQSDLTVNRKENEDKYKDTKWKVNSILNALNGDLPPICCICNDPIEGEPYKTFGELNYCCRNCWLNGDIK